MKRFALFAFAFIFLVACDTPSAPTLQRPTLQATPPSFAKISNDKFDISGTITNPCPPAEAVAYQGSIHLLITGEEAPTSSDLRAHINTQGISGVGLTSGDRYSIIENVKEEEPQTLLTVTAETVAGSPAFSAACRAGACPVPP